MSLTAQSCLIGVLVATLGLAVGSFANVVIARVPRNRSVVTPRSACLSCDRPIPPLENIPVLSWIALRGRCRGCRTAISFRYPLVELGTAIAYVATLARFGRDWVVLPYEVGITGIVILSVIDAEHLVLPRRIVWMHLGVLTATLIPVSLATGRTHHLVGAVVVAAVWSGAFFAINWASPRLLGFGDVRFSVTLGVLLGWISAPTALVGYFLANLIGVVVTGLLLLTHRTTRESPLPYGTYLGAGALAAIWFGPELLHLVGH